MNRSIVSSFYTSIPSSFLVSSSTTYRSLHKMASNATYGIPAGGASKYPPFKQAEAAREPFDGSLSYKIAQTCDTNWKPGQGLNDHPESGRFADDNAEFHVIQVGKTQVDPQTMYKLMVSSIAPRPVALVTTLNEDNSPNLAPISWYQMVSHNPAMVMISFGGSEDRRKDSELNIKRTNQFTVSSSNEPLSEALNYASIDTPHGVSEYALTGLTPASSKVVKSPRIKESPFSMECEADYVRDIYNDQGKHTTTLVLGRVKVLHIRKDTIHPVSGAIDAAKSLPITRIGGLQYARTTVGYELERPKWDLVKDSPNVKEALERGVKPTFECKDPVLEKYP